MQEKYKLEAAERKYIIEEQLHESRKIIYRNLIELPIFVANGNKNEIAQVEFNNKQLQEKIDVLLKELDSINEELK